jgi:hypothetical protein
MRCSSKRFVLPEPRDELIEHDCAALARHAFSRMAAATQEDIADLEKALLGLVYLNIEHAAKRDRTTPHAPPC